jgi:hypothetical protein
MKKVRILGIFIFLIVSVLLHYIYGIIPIKLFSIIAPVNESIWEHMKLIISGNLIYGILEYFLFKKWNYKYNNYILSYGISSIVGIIVYLIIYVPLYQLFGHVLYIAIGLLIIIFIFMQILNYYIMSTKKIKYGNIIGILIIGIFYLIFGYFTYYPPHINLFYDFMNKTYGIIK